MIKKMGSLFNIPPSIVPQGSAPWKEDINNVLCEQKTDVIAIAEGKHCEVRSRNRYSQKLAKQLQGIGVNVDINSGVEYPAPAEESVNNQASIADETLAALGDNGIPDAEETVQTSNGVIDRKGDNDNVDGDDGDGDCDDDKESVLSFSTWDPMKESFENKEFNSYHPNHDANYRNFREKHAPICGEDGKLKISPTKMSSEIITLYVSNIPSSLTEEGLRSLFGTHGNCFNVKKVSKGGNKFTYGFVSFRKVKEAEAAIQNLHGFDGLDEEHRLRVHLKRETKEVGHSEIRWGDNEPTSMDSDNWEESDGNTTEKSDLAAEGNCAVPEYRDRRVCQVTVNETATNNHNHMHSNNNKNNNNNRTCSNNSNNSNKSSSNISNNISSNSNNSESNSNRKDNTPFKSESIVNIDNTTGESKNILEVIESLRRGTMKVPGSNLKLNPVILNQLKILADVNNKLS